MRTIPIFTSLVVLSFVAVVSLDRAHAQRGPASTPLPAIVVATGIPGAGAIAQIGVFHKGGPFAAGFAPFTQPGRILDRARLFVASTSNFGAPLARPFEAPGSILSLDVSTGLVVVPENFAATTDANVIVTPTLPAAAAAGGKVILYTAQTPAFLNGRNNPGAVTKDLPSVSLPLGISFNNGFGRPWFANAPSGASGNGTISVTDPNGIGLLGAPDAVAGGVFTGNETNRVGTPAGGLTAAAVATALATKSPDLLIPQRAVFFAALADGRIDQVHVEKGVDPLVAGVFSPLPVIDTATAESTDPDAVTRVGMTFNWVPTRILYVTDPLANRIVAVDISDEGTVSQAVFTASNQRYLRSGFFDVPIDMTPAQPEVAARNFASNTTLGGGSDFYVLNRGNNSIVRMEQSGRVVAVRTIESSTTPGFRVNGLAVSEDGRTIWVTATTPNRGGVVLQLSAFGAAPVTTTMIAHAIDTQANGAIAQGASIFSQNLGPESGLGPLFNGQACDTCHNKLANGSDFAGGMGTTPDTFVRRAARVNEGGFDPLLGHGGPITRQRSIAEFGVPCGLSTGDPPQANTFSNRSAMTLRGTSLIDNIRVGDIEKARIAQPPDVRGRFNILVDGRVGKFGWKAHAATLVEFMGEAFRDEIGLTNPLAPTDLVSGCKASVQRPEADAVPLSSLVAFLNTIDPPSSASCRPSVGDTVFANLGCATCHTPSLPANGNATAAFLYSDLLLHEMGVTLADGFQQGSALGSEFRTAPLWRVSDRSHFLHDGRATSIVDAIRAHDGQAAGARDRYVALPPSDAQALLDFLRCI
jgi:Di-haem oxidoreductase, putative peroxidase